MKTETTLLLEPTIDDPLLAGVVEGSIDDLTQATRPAFLNNTDTPLSWGPDDWKAMDSTRADIFDLKAIERQFDPERYLSEGYIILEEIMTDQAREAWVEAAQVGQQINDRLLRADWSQFDWQALGRLPPVKSLTTAEIENGIGGSQQVPQADDDAGVLTLRVHSVFAEYFPAGHVPFLMNVLTHPQMLQLQRQCLGSESIYFDHNQLLTRSGGYPGNSWHSHRIGAGRDNCGMAELAEYRAQPNTNLTLCYPEGFETGKDGGLKIVRGSHLFRDPAGCRFTTDIEMEQQWLANRVHPVTGDPLRIERLDLPPGSLVCCLTHAAHAVEPKAMDRKTRWCTVYCYKKPDDLTGFVQPPSAIPLVWAMKAKRGELPELLRELLRPSFDRKLTGGRTEHNEN
jgi:hypothetical protein